MTGSRIDINRIPAPDAVFDAGDLGCGDGPLPRIASALREMAPGSILEIRSTNSGVSQDLPAWCRMTGHEFLGGGDDDTTGRYFVRRRSS